MVYTRNKIRYQNMNPIVLLMDVMKPCPCFAKKEISEPQNSTLGEHLLHKTDLLLQDPPDADMSVFSTCDNFKVEINETVEDTDNYFIDEDIESYLDKYVLNNQEKSQNQENI